MLFWIAFHIYGRYMSMYKYTITQPFTFQINLSFLKDVVFISEWLVIVNNNITILENYSWDGCSPKFKINNKIVGTPDFVSYTYKASLLHDALYQYAGRHSLARKQCDDIFLIVMNLNKFKLASFYYRMTRIFGGFFWDKNFNRNIKNNDLA